MINFNNLKGFGGAPPQDPESLLGYDPQYFDRYSPPNPPNPDAGGKGGRVNSYFQPIAVNTRQQNINNMYSTTDANGIIQNPYSSYDKTPFSDYVSQNAVTSEELQIARASVFGFYDYGQAVMPPIGDAFYNRRGPAVMPEDYGFRKDGGDYSLGGGDLSIRDGGRGYQMIDPIASDDNNKLFFDCKQNDGVFVYTKESVSLYGTLQLQKKMQFYTDKSRTNKLNPASIKGAKKMANGRYKFIYSGENGTQTLIVSPKGVLVNIKSGGC
jgi:hypothetical protein